MDSTIITLVGPLPPDYTSQPPHFLKQLCQTLIRSQCFDTKKMGCENGFPKIDLAQNWCG